MAHNAGYGYSPIVRRPHSRWPNGKRLAIYVAVGVEEYSDPNGMAEDIFPGAPKPDFVNISWRDYGNRVGAFRLFERLSSFGIPPTVLLNTDLYDTAPDVLAAARAAGAEFIGHGRSNSDSLATMPASETQPYVRSVFDRIAAEEGTAPRGWSSPWLAHNPGSLSALAASGFRYLLDFRLDDQPVTLQTTSGPLVALPYALELNDSTTAIGRQTAASDFADMIIDEFDEMLAASERQALVMSIVVHSFISGQPFRLRQLTRALEHIASRAEHVWLTQPRAILQACADNPMLICDD